MAIRVQRAREYRRVAWKNGGGETMEIAVSPQGAALDDFDWRISMAHVAADGPFSVFPGIDRTLTVLRGDGLCLTIAGREPLTLTQASLPLTFLADATTTADLVDGPVIDLNVMSRRGRFTHAVRQFDIDGKMDLRVDGAAILLFCQAGTADIVGTKVVATLGPSDSLLFDEAVADTWRVAAKELARLLLVTIRRA